MTTNLVSPKQPKYRRGKHPNSLKNLLGPRWEKGQSGNPYGYSLTSALKHSLGKPLKQLSEDAPARDLLIYSTLEGAIKREPTPFKEVWDRTEGRVPGEQPPNNNVNVIFVIGKGYRDLPGLIEGKVLDKSQHFGRWPRLRNLQKPDKT